MRFAKLISRKQLLIGVALCGLLAAAGCERHDDMHIQGKYNPLDESEFFADHSSARPLVEGTVPRGQLRTDTHYYFGMVNGKDATTFPAKYPDGRPFPTKGDALRQLVERGQERYAIYCSECHGDLGDGNGMIVQRGFVRPPSYLEARVLDKPVGHYFDTITNGYGAMFSYAQRVPIEDRWAIVAYVRTLQLSQGAALASLPAYDQEKVKAAASQQPEGAHGPSGIGTPGSETSPERPLGAPEVQKGQAQ